MKALVHVTLKQQVLDPQGKAIARACSSLGYDAVTSVRQGKLFEVTLDESDETAARSLVDELGKKLLANTVIEDYEVIRLDP
jgi:phosphoribosylformylglycinamidine synthase